MPSLALIVLRFLFLLFAGALAIFVGFSSPDSPKLLAHEQWLAFGTVVGVALVVLGVDILIGDKRLDTISAVYFGLIVGLFLTFVAGFVVSPFLDLITGPRPPGAPPPFLHSAVRLVIGMTLCYSCISLLIQTRNDFRFIIPYVEFSKQVKGLKPYVLDTSVVIDGRIADVVETSVLDSQLIMPRFVLAELQSIADSSDRLRRSRGRRGLDILNRLRNNDEIDLQMYDRELAEFAGQPVDLKLVLLAKHMDGKIVTNDYNLNKVARLHGVKVVNLNDLANALKPIFLPGEHMEVAVVKQGEEAGQGVGYLDDGTMVVVESGREKIGCEVEIVVTSVLQTSAGRMIFGRFEKPR